MRKIVCVLLAICCCMCLVSCGAEKAPKAPDDKLIQADLEEEVTYYKDFLSLKEFEIQQSLTEETEYSATISAVAESAYAEFELTADVVYTKYDQGWGLDSCDWQELGYSVVNYPDVEAATEWIRNGLGRSDEKWKNQENITVNEDTNLQTVIVHGNYKNSLGGRIDVVNNVVSRWSYDSNSDSWQINSSDGSEQVSLKKIEGIFSSKYHDGSIIISNVTEDGFDVCDTAFNTNTVHVTYHETDDGFIRFTGSGVDYNATKALNSYSFNNEGTNADITVTFSGNEEKVTVTYTVAATTTYYIADQAEMN